MTDSLSEGSPTGRQPGERPVALGFYSDNTASENQAHRIFSAFTPEEFGHAMSPALENSAQLLATINTPFARARSGEEHPFRIMESLMYSRDLPRIYHGQREIVALFFLINHLDGNFMLRAFPDRFREIINRPNESVDNMEKKSVGDQVNAMEKALQLSLIAAFTPPPQRRIIQRDDWQMFRDHEFNQIIEHVPDLTWARTPEQKIDAIISMLIPPTGERAKELHKEALIDECYWENIDPETLDRTNPSHREIFARAGKRVLALAGNLSAVFLDTSRQGYGPIFDVHEATHGGEISTDRRTCPAAPMVRAYLEGFGIALRDNRESVLTAIKQWDVFKGTSF